MDIAKRDRSVDGSGDEDDRQGDGESNFRYSRTRRKKGRRFNTLANESIARDEMLARSLLEIEMMIHTKERRSECRW